MKQTSNYFSFHRARLVWIKIFTILYDPGLQVCKTGRSSARLVWVDKHRMCQFLIFFATGKNLYRIKVIKDKRKIKERGMKSQTGKYSCCVTEMNRGMKVSIDPVGEEKKASETNAHTDGL